MKKFISLILMVVLTACMSQEAKPKPTIVTKKTLTPTSTLSVTVTNTEIPLTSTETIEPTETLSPTTTRTPTKTLEPTATEVEILPYPDAPLCPDHDATEWHSLWDSVRGCHYDHEHGSNPFTSQVEAAFPGFNLKQLLCNLEIGTCNPSGPMEPTHKHGGFKWNVQLVHPQTCKPYESATIGVNGSVIEYHGFGNYAMELDAPIHSVATLIRQCKTTNPTDYGYVFVNQHVSYGEIVSPYQGDLLLYPYYSVPIYDPSFGMYLSVDCIGQKLAGQRGACRSSLTQAQNNDANSTWTSKPTGSGARANNSSLVQILWRLRDTYQMFDWRDQEYPYSFLWLCSEDGSVYIPEGCEYNNTTTQIHEIQGTIPASWDNLAGFDTDTRVGRITASGFVTPFGDLNMACTEAGVNCHPIKLVQAFVGKYGSVLVFTPGKGTNIVPYLPERDIYFDGVPSGWVGAEN